MKKTKAKVNTGATVRTVLRHITRYTPRLVLSLVLAAIIVGLTLYIPILAGEAIDLIVEPGEVTVPERGMYFTQKLAMIAVCAILAGILQWIMNIVNNYITFHVVHDLRREAFLKIERLPLSYLDSHPSGDVLSRVINDADQFADGLLLGFTQLFTGAVTILGTLIFMLMIHPAITAVVVVLTPISLFVARFIANRTYNLFKKQSEIRGEQTAFINEMVKNQKLVRAFSEEERTLARFDEINERYRKSSLSAVFFSSLTNPCTRVVNNVVYAAVALTGAFAAVAGSITIGGLTCFLSYANQYTKPFNEISGVIAEVQNALACAARLFELIDETPESTDEGAESLDTPTEGCVSLKDVEFSYDPEKPLIEGLSLDVEKGQRIAIVGPTGCGKTTLINLLMRFYDVKGGEIAVDGRDIRGVTRHSLRGNYGMVLQETWLKSGTIRDNIIMGKPGATDEEIIAAAKASHAHSFIKRLPRGYDTVIGEDGGNLSEGQKQLLCITRIMLRLPPMLILDEATSSIDTRTELKIQEDFARLMKGRTSFIVAHRLSTIRDADLILVMRDGHIVEKGSHTDLLASGGFYSELYNSQFAAS